MMTPWALWLKAQIDSDPGLTLNTLAARSGVSRSTIGKWLSGSQESASLAHIQAVANSLGYDTLSALVGAGIVHVPAERLISKPLSLYSDAEFVAEMNRRLAVRPMMSSTG